jgi:hypothetical protein
VKHATTAAVAIALIVVAGQTASADAYRPTGSLHVSLTGPTFMGVGTTTTYRLLVTNTGPRSRGTGAFLDLPPGVELVRSTKGRCHQRGQLVACHLGSLQLAHFKYTLVTLRPTKPGVGTILMSASSLRREVRPTSSSLPVVLQSSPASADVSVAVSPGAPPEEHPSGYGFNIQITNSGPGDALRILVRYSFAHLLFAGLGFPAEGLNDDAFIGPRGTISKTCGWEPLGLDGNATDAPINGSFSFCIPGLALHETKTLYLGLDGPSGAAWSAEAEPITPDPDETNNITSQPLKVPTGVISPSVPPIVAPG